MREIKFRAWEDYKKRMLYTDWNSPHNWYCGSCSCKVAYARMFKDEKIGLSAPMQFTGFRDKTGKEIYEGDIIRYDWADEQNGNEEIVQVTWNDNMAGFYPFIRKAGWRFSIYSIEIIGNIYENPELLETTQ